MAAGWTIVMLLVLAWIPAYCGTLEYVIGAQAVRSRGGVFWKKHVTIPLRMITHVDVTQGPMERAFGVGTIHVQTAGAGGAQGAYAELRFTGIRELEELKELIMNGVRGYTIPTKMAGTQNSGRNEDGVTVLLKEILDELRALRRIIGKN